ncbi:MAG: type I methionyl aminopeptidase, partial [Dialister invisus]|nr:type I methionyl aminopeptidase [Dialister invisus]
GTPGHGPRLEEGMVICIEPMVTMGRADIITLRDGWGVVTADGLPAAHCEHTIAITGNGPRILTLRD